jgi:hypothetical protein
MPSSWFYQCSFPPPSKHFHFLRSGLYRKSEQSIDRPQIYTPANMGSTMLLLLLAATGKILAQETTSNQGHTEITDSSLDVPTGSSTVFSFDPSSTIFSFDPTSTACNNVSSRRFHGARHISYRLLEHLADDEQGPELVHCCPRYLVPRLWWPSRDLELPWSIEHCYRSTRPTTVQAALHRGWMLGSRDR